MRELKKGGAPGSRPETPPRVGKPDEVANKATNDNLSLEGRVVKATKETISKMTLNEFEGLCYDDWRIVLDEEKLKDLIRVVVREQLKRTVS